MELQFCSEATEEFCVFKQYTVWSELSQKVCSTNINIKEGLQKSTTDAERLEQNPLNWHLEAGDNEVLS